jgi:hypothetical protein
MLWDRTHWFVKPHRGLSAPASEPSDGTVLGVTERSMPVVLPFPTAERAAHAVVLAASGAGKSILTASALTREFATLAARADAETMCPCYVVLDPKGDLVSAVLQSVAASTPQALNRITFVNPFSPGGVAFNVCRLPLGATPVDIRADQITNLVAEMSTSSASVKIGIGARQRELLLHVILGVLDCDHDARSIMWCLDALQEPGGLKTLARLTRSERARSMLVTADPSDELMASCASRLRSAFAASAQLERLVTAEHCIDFAEVLRPGRILLIDLGSPPGGLVQLTEFWANLIVRLLVEHLLERRSPWSGHHIRVVIDEAQIVAPSLASVAELLLTTGRSRGLSLVTLSQGTTLLNAASPTLLRVLMTNTPLRIIGRLSAPDAELLAKEVTPKPGSDDSASVVRSRLVSAVTNAPDRQFFALRPGSRERFAALPVDVQAWAAAAIAHESAIAALQAQLAVPATSASRVKLSSVAVASKRQAKEQPARDRSRKGGRWG